MPSFSIRGAMLYVTDSGGDGEPVVLGHGYLMTHAFWGPVAAELEAAGYRVVTTDWRGQGRSEVTEDGYDPWDLADDLRALLDAIGIDRFHYVGHSMGGYVGYRLALRAPERVASLVQIGTAATAEGGLALVKYTALLWALRLLGYGAVVGRVIPIIYGSRNYLDDPARRVDVAEQRRRIESNDRLGVVRAGNGIFNRDDISGRLAEIAAPTLVVTGETDVPHPPEQGRADAAQIPDAAFVQLDGVGHAPPEEARDETARLTLDWLRRHPLDA